MWFKYNRMLLGKILLLLVILLLSGVSVFGCVQTGAQPRGWSGGTIANNTLFLGSMEGELVAVNTSDGSHLWGVPLETSSPATGGFGCAAQSAVVAIYGSPAVDGDLVYIGGYNGKVYAISCSTRLSKDNYLDKSNPQPIVGGPAVALGKVYFGCSDGKLYALDGVSLEKEWDFETGDKIWSTPVIDDGTIFIGSFDKKFYALNAISGEKKWEFETGGAIASTLLVYNNTVYVGSFDRYFYAVNAANGKLRWKFPAESWFWAKPVAYNNTVYAANLDGKVYVLDAENGGDKIAELDLESPVSSAPVLVGNSVIVASEEGRVWAIDTSNNEKRLLKDLGEKIYAPLSASEGIVYIHTEKDALYAMEAQTGAIQEFYIK